MTVVTIGFTGTRFGCTDVQKQVLEELLSLIKIVYADDGFLCEGLHGDCIGADAEFHSICRKFEMNVKSRPCTFKNMRAMTDAEEIAEPCAPMERNRLIVNDSNIMIACPHNMEEIKKGSGTWATIRFAHAARKRLHIVFPDGTVKNNSFVNL